MTLPPVRQLHLVANLNLEIDGQTVQIRGDGQDVTVAGAGAPELSRQLGLAASAVGGGLRTRRRRAGQLANAAERSGFRITVLGNDGPLVAIGRDVNTRVMGRMVGSRHIRVRLNRESVQALVHLVPFTVRLWKR